jgi:hypothetical protein
MNVTATFTNNTISNAADTGISGTQGGGATETLTITSNILTNNGKGIDVQGAASPLNIITNTVTGGSGAGITVADAPLLNYTDNIVTGNANGGAFSNITKINYTASAAGTDTVTITPTTVADNGNQAITYTSVPTMNVRTLAGNDQITATPANALTVWVDAGADTDIVNYDGLGGVDNLNFITAPTVGPDISATESVYRVGNVARVNIANAETRRIRTLAGDDTVTYVRLGGSVATPFTIEGGDDNDNILAGLGNDTILGGFGNDRIDGANGDDSILGEDGNDTMFGGVGNDILRTGAGENQAFGQNGNDQIFSDNGVLDFVDGGAGFDTGTVDGIDLVSSIESLV